MDMHAGHVVKLPPQCISYMTDCIRYLSVCLISDVYQPFYVRVLSEVHSCCCALDIGWTIILKTSTTPAPLLEHLSALQEIMASAQDTELLELVSSDTL